MAAASPLLKEILEPFSIEEEVIISLPEYTQREIKYLVGLLYGDKGALDEGEDGLDNLARNHLLPDTLLSKLNQQHQRDTTISIVENTKYFDKQMCKDHLEQIALKIEPDQALTDLDEDSWEPAPNLENEISKPESLCKPQLRKRKTKFLSFGSGSESDTDIKPSKRKKSKRYSNYDIKPSKKKKHYEGDSDSDVKPPKKKKYYKSDSDFEIQPLKKKKSDVTRKQGRLGIELTPCSYCSSLVKFRLMRYHITEKHFTKLEEYLAGTDRPPHRGKFPKKCDYCDRYLSCRRKMESHVRSHERRGETGTRSYICDICAEVFSLPALLAAHVKSHKNDVPCTFESCAEAFRNQQLYRIHMLHEHAVDMEKPKVEKKELCTDCGAGYKSAAGLRTHQKYVCGGKAKVVPQLNSKCEVCNKAFTSYRDINVHKLLHSEPTFQCSHCDKKFHLRKYLARHIRSVHLKDENKRFRCNICQKGFTEKQNLLDHENTHTGRKPYQCRWCDNSYQNGSNLMAHERSNHRDLYAPRPLLQNRTRERVQARGELRKVRAARIS